MLGNEIEPPEAHALALEYITYISLYSSCIVRRARRPEEVERHGTDEDHKSLPSGKGAEGMHHPHT